MIFLILWLAALVIAFIHVAVKRTVLTRPQKVQVILLYQIAFSFGLAGIVTFIGHALRPEQTAAGIGWVPHPQFQFELAAFGLGLGLAAFLCLFLRNKYYWLGVIIAPAIFQLLAAWQHIREAVVDRNLVPYNTLTAVTDILIPATALILLVYYFNLTKPSAA